MNVFITQSSLIKIEIVLINGVFINIQSEAQDLHKII